MKKITIAATAALLSIIFTGCDMDTTDEFNIDKKEILTSNKWYFIDNNSQIYTIADFYDNKIIKKVYTDSSFNDIAYSKSYDVTYNNDTLYLTDEYGKHECKYSSCENNDWMEINCDKSNTTYVKGWSSTEKARSHAAQ